MSLTSGAGRGLSSEINVTPLIDVVLVLLIIFMVLMPMMRNELPAVVPRVASEDTPAAQDSNPIIVHLRVDGALILENQPVAAELLGERLAQRLASDPLQVVFFDADDAASYARAVEVMDICKGAGAKAIGIVTHD